MTPYLLLPADRRSRVRKILEEHAFEDDTVEATTVLLEELGANSNRIADALYAEEQNGFLRAGTFNELAGVMAGTARGDVDWRNIPRRGRR